MSSSNFQSLTLRFNSIVLFIQLFYAFVFFLQFQTLTNVNFYSYANVTPLSVFNYVFWPENYLKEILFLTPIITMATAVFPQFQWLRIFCAISVFFFFGIQFSIQDINNSLISTIWVCFVFAFAKSWKQTQNSRYTTCNIIFNYFIATAAFLMTYFLAGLWKFIFSVVVQPLSGEAGLLSKDAMSATIAAYLIRTDTSTWLGAHLIELPWLGLTMLIFLILFELLAIVPLFKGKYYLPFGIFFLMFHLFSVYIFNIGFSPHVFLIFIFLIKNPLKKNIGPGKFF